MGGYIGAKVGKLVTTAANVSGDATIGGNLTVKGTTVTVDSATAQTVDLGDNDKIRMGDGDDLQLYHDGTHSYVDDTGTGRLYLRGNDRVQIQKYTGEDMITAIADDGVKLYHDNSNKLETTSSGVTVSGDLAVTSGTDAALSVNDAVGEVGSGNLALQVTNSAGSALKPLGFRAEDIRFATGSSERMRIDSNGKVAINHTTPLSTFHVRESGSDGGTLRVGGNGAALGLELLYDQSVATVTYIQSNPTYTNTNSLMHIRVDGDANPDQLVLKGDGAVCIGVQSVPSAGSGGSAFKSDSNGRKNLFMSTSSTNNQGLIVFTNPNGQVGYIGTNGSATTYHTSSDYRLKENVTNISDGITRVKQLSPKRFNFIADADTTVDGFLAHEAQTVVPEAIGGTKDEVEVWGDHEELPDGVSVGDNKLDDDGKTIPVMQGIDQSKLVPLLTAALQEAIAKIEILETKVAALEG